MPNTLICSTCGFEAATKPKFSTNPIPKSEMEGVYSRSWNSVERAAYSYFMDFMKLVELEPLQAARTAFEMVERWRFEGRLVKYYESDH